MTDQSPFNPDIIAEMAYPERHFAAPFYTLQSFFDSGFVILSKSDLAEKQIFYQISQKQWEKIQDEL